MFALRTTWLALLFALACSTAAAQVNPNDYRKLDDLPADGSLRTDAYRFDYLAPDQALRDLKATWYHYQHTGDSSITALVIGIPGTSTYSLSVRPPAQPAGPTTDALAYVRGVAGPDERYVRSKANPQCALHESAVPLGVAPDFVLFNAACVDPKSGKLLEITLSWKDDHLRIHQQMGDLADESRRCEGGETKACNGSYPQMRRAFVKVVDSFRFAN